MLLEVIGSLASGLFHQLGKKLGDVLVRSKQNAPRRTTDQPVADLNIPDQEVWNTVTSYGKYKEVWPIYRTNGLLEAIKVRDEKAEFDQKMSQTRSPEYPPISPPQQNSFLEPVPTNVPLIIFPESDIKLNELDLAFVRGLASYFKEMNATIRNYYHDHNATKEEADVIANYYLKTSDIVRGVKTRQDLEELLKLLERLKEKVSRYKCKNYKYRLSTSLKKEVIEKLKKIIDNFND
jgi:hypothetical protein